MGGTVTKEVQPGKWRTVETLINVTGSAFFRLPAGAKIKVYVGKSPIGWSKQEQTLDGSTYKKLAVGGIDIIARMQVKVRSRTWITYYYEPGHVIAMPPIKF
jgi:hypothetical protein